MISGLVRVAWFCSVLWCALLGTADARTATGYSHGIKKRIEVVAIGDAEVEVNTARAFRTMAKAARKAGIELVIRSGFRSHEKQKQLYKEYRRGWGNLAARPGYSNHQSGRALDIYIDDYNVYEWLRHHAGKFGFKRTVKREAWHWEYVGTRQARRR
jgi:LAS superfamily LD-carboxypeptidase LdcB